MDAVCEFCQSAGGSLGVFLLASPNNGRCATLLHRDCAKERGFWCDQHQQGHAGLLEGPHCCPGCCREAWGRLSLKADSYYNRLLNACLPLEQYRLLQQSLRYQPLGDLPPFAIVVFNRLFFLAFAKVESLDDIEAMIDKIIAAIIGQQTFIGYVVSPSFAEMVKRLGLMIEPLLMPLPRHNQDVSLN